MGSDFMKEPGFYGAFAGNIDNIFTSILAEEHRKRKRLMASSFSRTSLKDHEQLIYSMIQPLMRRLSIDVEHNNHIPLYPTFRKLTLGVIMAFCFGYNDKDPQGVDTLMFSKLTPVFDTSPRELLLVSSWRPAMYAF